MPNTEKLKAKMSEKGHTQRTLSAEMRMDKNTLNAKVNGKRPFTDQEIESASKALEIKGAAEVCAIFLPWVEGE